MFCYFDVFGTVFSENEINKQDVFPLVVQHEALILNMAFKRSSAEARQTTNFLNYIARIKEFECVLVILTLMPFGFAK